MTLQLTLPGTWFEVPLGSEHVSDRLREFVRELLGKEDRFAARRALAHQRLLRATERAEQANAEQLHVGVALTEDVPLPGSITVYPSVPVSATRSSEAKTVIDAFIPAVIRAETDPVGGEPVPGADDRVFEVGERRILRRPRLRFDPDPDIPPGMLIDYWLTVPGTNRVQLVHVSIPEALHTTLYATLFDEIVFASKPGGGTALRRELLLPDH